MRYYVVLFMLALIIGTMALWDSKFIDDNPTQYFLETLFIFFVYMGSIMLIIQEAIELETIDMDVEDIKIRIKENRQI